MTRMLVATLILACSACGDPIDVRLGVSAQTLEAPLMIDDFTSGPAHVWSKGGTLVERQPGTMAGGVREVVRLVNPHPFQQATAVTVMKHDGAGRLIVSSGLHSQWGTYLIYGYDLAGTVVPLDLDLSGYNTIRLDFRSNDQPTSGVIELYEAGEYATANWYAEPSSTAFSVDAPYATFTTTTGNPLPLEHVDQIVVLLQSGSPNAGSDLELASVSAQLIAL